MSEDETTEAAAPEETTAVAEDETAEPEAPTEGVVGADGERVEAVGSGGSGAKSFYVYECSAGDFISRVSAAEVEAHIAGEHGGKVAAKTTSSRAKAKPKGR